MRLPFFLVREYLDDISDIVRGLALASATLARVCAAEIFEGDAGDGLDLSNYCCHPLALDRSFLPSGQDFSSAGRKPLRAVRLWPCTDRSLQRAVRGPALARIQKLDLTMCQELLDVEPLRRHPTLRELRLHGCRGLFRFPVLGGCPNLELLDVSSCCFDPDHQAGFAFVPPSLRTMIMRNCETIRSLECLKGGVGLETLDATGCASLRDISSVGEATRLRVLSLRSCVHVTSIDAVSALRSLEELDVTCCVRLRSLRALAGNGALAVAGSRPGPEPATGPLPRLRVLEIGSASPVIDMAPVWNLPALEVLGLGSCADCDFAGPLDGMYFARRMKTLRGSHGFAVWNGLGAALEAGGHAAFVRNRTFSDGDAELLRAPDVFDRRRRLLRTLSVGVLAVGQADGGSAAAAVAHPGAAVAGSAARTPEEGARARGRSPPSPRRERSRSFTDCIDDRRLGPRGGGARRRLRGPYGAAGGARGPLALGAALGRLVGVRVRALDLCQWSSGEQQRRIGRLLGRIGSTVQDLNVSRSGMRDLSELRGCAALTRIDCVDCPHLKSLVGLGRADLAPRLLSLDLSGCRRLCDVSPLMFCVHLETLYLTGCLSVHSLHRLGACRALRTLNTAFCASLRDVADLAFCPRLETLETSHCRRLCDVSALGGCRALRSLDVADCPELNPEGVVALVGSAPSLRRIDVSGCPGLSAWIADVWEPLHSSRARRAGRAASAGRGGARAGPDGGAARRLSGGLATAADPFSPAATATGAGGEARDGRTRARRPSRSRRPSLRLARELAEEAIAAVLGSEAERPVRAAGVASSRAASSRARAGSGDDVPAWAESLDAAAQTPARPLRATKAEWKGFWRRQLEAAAARLAITFSADAAAEVHQRQLRLRQRRRRIRERRETHSRRCSAAVVHGNGGGTVDRYDEVDSHHAAKDKYTAWRVRMRRLSASSHVLFRSSDCFAPDEEGGVEWGEAGA